MSRQTIGVILLVLMGATHTASSLQASFGSRRDFVVAVTTTTATTSTLVLAPEPSISKATTTATLVQNERRGESLSVPPSSKQLLSIIPAMESGAPATNATIPIEVSSRIEDLASLLEQGDLTKGTNQKNNAVSPLLSGSWRLLFSNAPEIVSLSKGLPLGFRLGPTYQPLDTAKGYFENTATLDHPYKLGALKTIVIGTVEKGTKGSLNSIGVANTENNRVDVRFEVIVFELDEVFGRKLGTPIRKILVPAASENSSEAKPANDQTYLDETARIVRGGDGSLFVFSRADETGDARMMAERERFELTTTTASSSGSARSSSTPVGEDLERQRQQKEGTTNIPAEIKYLFQEQRR